MTRVVWSQGLFLQPQHFQVLESSMRETISAVARAQNPRGYGFVEYEIDEALLKQGKLALNRVVGVLPDGTVLDAPRLDPLPEPLAITQAVVRKRIYLGVPLALPRRRQFGDSGNLEPDTRFQVVRVEVPDVTAADPDPVELDIGQLRLCFGVGSEASAGLSAIPLAVVADLDRDGGARLSEAFIATVMLCSGSEWLREMLADLHSRLHLRSQALAGRAAQGGRMASTEHFLEASMLMAINRYKPVFEELARAAPVHPFDLYLLCVQAAGELVTLGPVTRAAPSFPGYYHDDLYASFSPVLRSLSESLGHVLASAAIQLQLNPLGYGFYGAKIDDVKLINPRHQFILTVYTDLPPDDIRTRFSGLIKIAPATKIKDLVASAVPGITLHLLSTAPAEIRFPSARCVYFELDGTHPLWREMSTGLYVHIADEFPGLRMELWVIRGNEEHKA